MRQRLGEEVCFLRARLDPDEADEALGHLVAKEMVFDIDVLAALQVALLRCHENGGGVIDEEDGGLGLSVVEVGELHAQRVDLARGLAGCDVLGLGAALRDGRLLLAAPDDGCSGQLEQQAGGRGRLGVVICPVGVAERD